MTSISNSAERTLRGLDWGPLWQWLLGFGAVAYLGLSGGGYDPLVSDQVGIALWWILLLGVLVGALPASRPGPAVLACTGLLAALLVWATLSLSWTESSEKTAADVALLATLLAGLALAALSRGRGGARQMVAAVASAVFLIAVVALLSRLHPAWFPAAEETGRFLSTGRERLSYPLDYWNGLAALIGLGLPLMLQLACEARRPALRGLAAAALPAMFLALYFTLSRGGIVAGAIALAVYLAFAPDRIPRFLILLLCGAGGGVLVLLASHRTALAENLGNATAHAQGDQMLWLTLAVCALVGLARVAVPAALGDGGRPAWSRPDRSQSLTALAVAALVAVVALAALDAPGRVSHAWHEFKRPSGASTSGTGRLGSSSGENRYQLWSSALREFEQDPLTGTGSGTFQLWWARNADVAAPVLDAHSLYLQTLGELGLVGLALLLGIALTSLVAGGLRTLRAPPGKGGALAAALAASTVLWTTSFLDWTWKLPIIPLATFLLLAVLLTDGAGKPRTGFRWPLRGAVAAAALAALVAVAIPFTTASLLRQSQNEARDGDLAAALSAARGAQNAMPAAAGPLLQEALVLEAQGLYDEAAAAARGAIGKEDTNWRLWLVLARIDAQRGKPAAALAAYRRARALNPFFRF